MSQPAFKVDIDPQALQALGAGGFGGPEAKALAEAMARTVADAIRDELEEAPPRTGREYYVPGTKTKYTASAPGEVPAIREGHYRDSWKATKGTVVGRKVVASAVSDEATEDGDAIGLLLEDGTSDLVNYRVRMEPRPHIREGINRARPSIDSLLRGGA